MFKRLLVLIAAFSETIQLTIERIFREKDKIATGKTLESLRHAVEIDLSKGLFNIETIGSKVFEYIENGRPANSKMPPAGVLQDWMQARGIPLSKEFAIRRSIAINGIAPTPIISTAFIEVRNEFSTKLAPQFLKSITESIAEAIRDGFKFP